MYSSIENQKAQRIQVVKANNLSNTVQEAFVILLELKKEILNSNNLEEQEESALQEEIEVALLNNNITFIKPFYKE